MRKQILFLVIMAVFIASGFALSLEEAVSFALENNISIKREQISLEAVKRTSAHSWNTLLPSLSLSANDEISSEKGFQNNFGVEGKVSVSLTSGYFASIKKAKADFETAKISYDQAVSEIISQVKKSYFSLIYEKENLKYLIENLENAKKQAGQNEERFKRGTLSELEYLSSKVAYEKLKPELKAQELSYQNNLKSFCLILGLDEKEDFSRFIPEGSLENFISRYALYFDESMKTAISKDVSEGNIPAIQNLKNQLFSAKKEVSKTKLSVWGPTLNFSYTVAPVLRGEKNGRVKQTASIGLTLPLENFLPFSQGADSVKAAKDSVNDIQLQLEEKEKNTKMEFSLILKSLEQKGESIRSFQNYVELAGKTYESAKVSYLKGTMDFLSMQNAAKNNLEAKLNLQKEFLETLKLYISLEKLCGKNAI
ncbi:TolC family protein [Treponema sp.]|uniref:TolC family protein n=1 Tax=Treponema sp. TaxID=166 RepID=UPI00298ECBAB|nr:TolC family protein [Treponema sp.]MCR5614205.1 TolC family protein [Treponema sp.]